MGGVLPQTLARRGGPGTQPGCCLRLWAQVAPHSPWCLSGQRSPCSHPDTRRGPRALKHRLARPTLTRKEKSSVFSLSSSYPKANTYTHTFLTSNGVSSFLGILNLRTSYANPDFWFHLKYLQSWATFPWGNRCIAAGPPYAPSSPTRTLCIVTPGFLSGWISPLYDHSSQNKTATQRPRKPVQHH